MQDAPISGLARAAGVETIRYDQRRGLLETPQRSGGLRRYGAGDLHRLRFIRSAQAAGFTLEQIAELIALDATEDRPRALALARERLAALGARHRRDDERAESPGPPRAGLRVRYRGPLPDPHGIR